jgi:hypothetical protein
MAKDTLEDWKRRAQSVQPHVKGFIVSAEFAGYPDEATVVALHSLKTFFKAAGYSVSVFDPAAICPIKEESSANYWMSAASIIIQSVLDTPLATTIQPSTSVRPPSKTEATEELYL